MKPPQKILILKGRALGDTVLVSASVMAWRKAFPNSEIHVLVPDRWASILEEHPAISRLWKLPSGSGALSRWVQRVDLTSQLRHENFDALVNLHASPSSARLARNVDAPIRAFHFHGHHDANRYSTVIIPGKGTLKPCLERDLDALRAIGLPLEIKTPTPQLSLTEDERAQAREWILTHKLKAPLLSLGIGASRPTKSWPIERFASLALQWAKQTGGSALALASQTEMMLLNQFQQSLGATSLPILSAAPKSVRELAALLSESTLFVGNDSGPKHIAVAVGRPTLTLFGPEHPFEWHPYDPKRHWFLFLEGLSCRKELSPNGQQWCGIPQCLIERHRCMTEFSAEDVFRHCFRLYESVL